MSPTPDHEGGRPSGAGVDITRVVVVDLGRHFRRSDNRPRAHGGKHFVLDWITSRGIRWTGGWLDLAKYAHSLGSVYFDPVCRLCYVILCFAMLQPRPIGGQLPPGVPFSLTEFSQCARSHSTIPQDIGGWWLWEWSSYWEVADYQRFVEFIRRVYKSAPRKHRP